MRMQTTMTRTDGGRDHRAAMGLGASDAKVEDKDGSNGTTAMETTNMGASGGDNDGRGGGRLLN